MTSADLKTPFSDRRFCSDLFLFIQRQKLLPAGSRVLLAVSGGLDSMLLLDFFRRFGKQKYGLDWGVAHLDHGLRPGSGADAAWLAEFCRAAEIPFWQARLEVAKHHAKSPQSSLEAVARDLRYDWLLSLAIEQGFNCLATAHTASDQAEGMLMRLVRGSLAGLGGMAPLQSRAGICLIRPLLSQTRPSLEAYAAFQQLIWREDPSNAELDFFRNRLRHQILPLLRQENARLDQHWSEHALLWQDEQTWLEQLTAEAASASLKQESGHVLLLDLRLFQGYAQALQRRLVKTALTQLLGEWKVFTSRHLEAVCQLADADTGKSLNLPRQVRVSRRKHALAFEQETTVSEAAPETPA
ncbi:MAG: tRNA lysidine(34) synthetase TilS [Candidatus Sericytochromatia bacterium]|nr:tRNA lysidine(34) synthetase TilS [Candidatus Sericytochromatia bacterium]